MLKVMKLPTQKGEHSSKCTNVTVDSLYICSYSLIVRLTIKSTQIFFCSYFYSTVPGLNKPTLLENGNQPSNKFIYFNFLYSFYSYNKKRTFRIRRYIDVIKLDHVIAWLWIAFHQYINRLS